MKERFLLQEVQPDGYAALKALDQYVNNCGLSRRYNELIKIRTSQLNGCAFCLDKHARDARSMGETEQRIYLLDAWREAPQFTEQEKTILAMTEEITHISRQGLTEDTYRQALHHFGLAGTAQLIMAIVNINAWTRIGISTRRIPR